MRLIPLTALALVVASQPGAAQGSCTPGDTARTREELTIIYSRFRDGFIQNAPQVWIDALDSSFTLTLFNGTIMPRDWVEGYVRSNATRFRIQTLAMVIRSLKPTADSVVALIEQTSDREFNDEQGASHRLEVGALQIETWVCRAAGWRLAKVKEDSLLYLRRDGK